MKMTRSKNLRSSSDRTEEKSPRMNHQQHTKNKYLFMNRYGYRTFCLFVLVSGLLLASFPSCATQYTIRSDEEFNELTLVAGDVVTWLDGTYTDQKINWSGQQGTVENPITLKAETPGGVIFTGTSKINFHGSYLIVDGFYWKGGQGENNHIEFRKDGSNSEFSDNCIIRNCAFDNLYTQEPDKSRWVVLYGSDNVVENCSFMNKESAGALILVELSYSQSITPGHIIRNNYFYNVTPKDNLVTNANDSETIRIGESSYQAISAQVLVEGNYFQKTDGENEIISNKSADNTFRHNTFRNCRGSLVMRHGARAHVEGNFFLGEGKAKSGGIRISDRDHVIINNYMQGLNNDGDIWNNAITLVGGGASSGGTSSGYQNVDNVIIAHNTIYNSDDPIFYNNRESHDPTGAIAYNLVYSENGDIVAGDITGTGQGITYEGNIFGGSVIGISDSGIIQGDANFSSYGETFKPSSTGIAANTAGNSYSDLVNFDIEGLTRPNSDLDVGAHEISGAIGSVNYRPLTDADIGLGVGACFIGKDGNVLPECGIVGDYLIASKVSGFDDTGGTKSASVTSNVSWTVTDDRDWISVTPSSGSGNGNIDITVSPHTNTSERTGNVKLSGTGVEDEIILVAQLAYETPVDVTDVSLVPGNVTIGLGGSQELFVAISPSDATNQEVVFQSDNANVATVDESGNVMAVSVGSATITVTTDDGGFTAASTIDVISTSSGINWALNQPVTATGTADGVNIPSNLVDDDAVSRWSVQGFPQSAIIDLGGDFTIHQTEVICHSDRAYQFTIEGSPTADGSYRTLVDRSNNSTPGTTSVPIIDVVDPVAARFVRITCIGADEYNGEWVSLTELRVFGEGEREDVAVTGVALDYANISLQEGETQQLTATISPLNATNQDVAFSSSNPSIATVSATGLVMAIVEGEATITATTNEGDYIATTAATVKSPVVLSANDFSEDPYPWLTPNPASSIVMINGSDHFQTVSIFDQTGKLVMKKSISKEKFLDINKLQAGIFLVKFQGNEGSIVSRLIKL